jgi:hypothetical protein
MKYYIVSEEELFNLVHASIRNVYGQQSAYPSTRDETQQLWKEAEAACRARKVVYDEPTDTWYEVSE